MDSENVSMEAFNKELEQELIQVRAELGKVTEQRDAAEEELGKCEDTLKEATQAFNKKVAQLEEALRQSRTNVSEQDRLMYVIKVLFAMLQGREGK
jgi:predicted  nucleic acid-binding Zn-ribbon protein